jgi:hypothetical protein
MNALIIKGNDNHYSRLLGGLQACQITTCLLEKEQKEILGEYDLVFIDPSYKFHIPNINGNLFFFFDTEDATNHFDKGVAYDQFKDKVKAYAKYNYEPDDRKDGIKNIGIPLAHYISLIGIANKETKFNEQNLKPYILASPTFIGRYIPKPSGYYNSQEDINCLGKYDDGNFMYNQRIDWLLSLKNNNIPYAGGIVFTPNCNLSLEWQSKYFGNVNKLRSFPLPLTGLAHELFKYQIGLNPTGHERISWRTFDIMATGGILINTDTKNKLTLINPKEYITIYDGQDL